MAFDTALYRFEPAGWLEHEHSTHRCVVRPRVCATVEIRGNVSSTGRQALVGGSFEPHDGSSLRVRVAHSGQCERVQRIPCNGLLGRPLLLGLPVEFASGVATTLTSDPHEIHAGCLTVNAGAYDEAGSSQVAFSLATELLKWILLTSDPDAVTADHLAARWRKLGW
ncbi:MAG: hypothetical protein QOI48_3649 [Solirubrobacteraceae bacterium]|nr:hypothetical protein [Solirubrobacteraceae bacterium]